jgi:hypothetical protein
VCRTKSTELKSADFRMQQKWIAERVAELPDDAALEWAVTMKDEGNAQYRRGEFTSACDTYLMALLGLRVPRSGGAQGAASDAANPFSDEQIDRVQVPVLCNLAACKLGLKVSLRPSTVSDHTVANYWCALLCPPPRGGLVGPWCWGRVSRGCATDTHKHFHTHVHVHMPQPFLTVSNTL